MQKIDEIELKIGDSKLQIAEEALNDSSEYEAIVSAQEKTPKQEKKPADNTKKGNGKKIALKVGEIAGKVLLCAVSFVLIVAMGLLCAIYMISKGPSTLVRETFVNAVTQTGALGFCAHLFLSDAEVQAIVDSSRVIVAEGETDTSMIVVGGSKDEKDPVIDEIDEEKGIVYNEQQVALIDIKGGTYVGKVLIVKDPSRVSVAGLSKYGDGVKGISTEQMAKDHNALAAINAGGYEENPSNYVLTGGIPMGDEESGIVIIDGKLMWGNLSQSYDIIGFDNNGILHVDRMTAQEALDKGIRDAVNWGPVLVKNGEPSVTPTVGLNVGIHPRTAIGQRSDGSVILVVIDGRQAHSLGASYDDLTSIMMEFGAVNAANLDGGMSSYMVYDNEVITSPYMLYWNGRRNVSTSFIVSRLEDNGN